MDPQITPENPAIQNQGTPTPPVNSELPPSNGGESVVSAGSDGKASNGIIDLSQFFKDGEVGVFDSDKILKLAEDRDNKAKSAKYFQSQYMTKNEVPENIEGYEKDFKPDSVYEKFMDQDNVKATIKSIREFGLKNGMGSKHVNAVIDFTLKNFVASGSLDGRTPEQKQAEQDKINAAEIEKLAPYFAMTKRTMDQQNEIIDKFLDTPNIFSNDSEIKSFLQKIAEESAVGYKTVSYLIDSIESAGYKAMPATGPVGGVGASEFWSKYNSEGDPIKRQAMLDEFEKINGK